MSTNEYRVHVPALGDLLTRTERQPNEYQVHVVATLKNLFTGTEG